MKMVQRQNLTKAIFSEFKPDCKELKEEGRKQEKRTCAQAWPRGEGDHQTMSGKNGGRRWEGKGAVQGGFYFLHLLSFLPFFLTCF